MDAEGLNQSQLAKRLGVSKGYVSQVLNGNFNHTVRKLIELSLAIGMVPVVVYETIPAMTKKRGRRPDHKVFVNQIKRKEQFKRNAKRVAI
jgi:transcriptional regulator with XRE-family HTH domain